METWPWRRASEWSEKIEKENKQRAQFRRWGCLSLSKKLLCLYTYSTARGGGEWARGCKGRHTDGQKAREERAATADWILTWNSKEDHDRAQVGVAGF